MLGLTQPIFEGAYVGFLNLESTQSTEWISVIPADFKDSRTGLAIPAGQCFGNLTIINVSNDTVYLRLREGLSSDPTDGEIPLTASAVISLNVQGSRGGALTVLQVKKADISNEVQFLATFNPVSIL